jgi:hypothetical protein
MQRSTHKILTTHVGSLPAPEGLAGEAAVRQLVERQRQTGLDIINEGEYTKGGDWLSFTDDRRRIDDGERKGPPLITLGGIARSLRIYSGPPNAAQFSSLAIRSKGGPTGFVPAPSLTPASRFCSVNRLLKANGVPETTCS